MKKLRPTTVLGFFQIHTVHFGRMSSLVFELEQKWIWPLATFEQHETEKCGVCRARIPIEFQSVFASFIFYCYYFVPTRFGLPLCSADYLLFRRFFLSATISILCFFPDLFRLYAAKVAQRGSTLLILETPTRIMCGKCECTSLVIFNECLFETCCSGGRVALRATKELSNSLSRINCSRAINHIYSPILILTCCFAHKFKTKFIFRFIRPKFGPSQC